MPRLHVSGRGRRVSRARPPRPPRRQRTQARGLAATTRARRAGRGGRPGQPCRAAHAADGRRVGRGADAGSAQPGRVDRGCCSHIARRPATARAHLQPRRVVAVACRSARGSHFDCSAALRRASALGVGPASQRPTAMLRAGITTSTASRSSSSPARACNDARPSHGPRDDLAGRTRLPCPRQHVSPRLTTARPTRPVDCDVGVRAALVACPAWRSGRGLTTPDRRDRMIGGPVEGTAGRSVRRRRST
jgi:hypothetical protein